MSFPSGEGRVRVSLASPSWRFLQEPAVLVSNEKVVFEPRISTPVFVLAYAPIILALAGLVGGIVGALAISLNMTVMRARLPGFVRMGCMVIVSALAVALYVAAVALRLRAS